jgi:urease accessory protein
MSSSPGILDGDAYHLQIDLAKKCSLELKTQSYQRLFQMKKGAKQFLNLNLEEGSSFVYIPHPLVPHYNSVFLSKNKIVMNENCSLTWGEVMSCGRKLNGEVFKFSSFHSVTEIFFRERLVVKENIVMKPNEVNLRLTGQLEGYTHQASLVFINKAADVDKGKESVLEFLQQQENIQFGASALPVNGMIVRLLGYKAEQLFDLLNNVSVLLSHQRIKEPSYVA